MKRFQLKKHQTSIQQEVTAGFVSFFAISYIIIVNPLILSETGLPAEMTVFSTIFTAAFSSLLMGYWANAPLVMSPGMGENAFFTYTMVAALGLSYQDSLTAVLFSGVLFVLLAYGGMVNLFATSIPSTLKQAITAGLGLFLVFIGLENSGLIMDGGETGLLELGRLNQPMTFLALISLLFTAFLFLKKVKGSFLISIFFMTIVSHLTGIYEPAATSFSLSNLAAFPDFIGTFDFSNIFKVEFLLSVLSLTMLIVFESIGMVEAFVKESTRSSRAFKVAGISALLSGVLGTSPAIPTAESGAGIKEGGKTGLTSLTVGVLFLLSLFFTPLLAYIPMQALGPVLIITGASMMENLKFISMDDFSEWFPAFLVLIMMPFTGSVINGMAFGFIAYVFLKLATGRKETLNAPLILISILFLLTLFANAIL